MTERMPIALSCAALFLGGCAAPSINLATNEPIKVDINMRVDVYQYDAGGAVGKPAAAKPAITGNGNVGATPEERRRNRQADIQVFKNSRLIGEGRNGLLAVLDEPAGDYGDQIRRTVDQENADRMEEMKKQAEREKRPLGSIQEERAGLWMNRSFTGEWIEQKKSDGTYQWTQKAG